MTVPVICFFEYVYCRFVLGAAGFGFIGSEVRRGVELCPGPVDILRVTSTRWQILSIAARPAANVCVDYDPAEHARQLLTKLSPVAIVNETLCPRASFNDTMEFGCREQRVTLVRDGDEDSIIFHMWQALEEGGDVLTAGNVNGSRFLRAHIVSPPASWADSLPPVSIVSRLTAFQLPTEPQRAPRPACGVRCRHPEPCRADRRHARQRQWPWC